MFVSQFFFDGTDNGLRIISPRTEGGTVYQISYDTICMEGINTPSLSSTNGGIVLDTQYVSGAGNLPPYCNEIHFHDIYADTTSATVSSKAWDNVRLNGTGGIQPMASLSFYNVDFTEPQTATAANLDSRTIYLYSNSQA